MLAEKQDLEMEVVMHMSMAEHVDRDYEKKLKDRGGCIVGYSPPQINNNNSYCYLCASLNMLKIHKLRGIEEVAFRTR